MTSGLLRCDAGLRVRSGPWYGVRLVIAATTAHASRLCSEGDSAALSTARRVPNPLQVIRSPGACRLTPHPGAVLQPARETYDGKRFPVQVGHPACEKIRASRLLTCTNVYPSWYKSRYRIVPYGEIGAWYKVGT